MLPLPLASVYSVNRSISVMSSIRFVALKFHTCAWCIASVVCDWGGNATTRVPCYAQRLAQEERKIHRQDPAINSKLIRERSSLCIIDQSVLFFLVVAPCASRLLVLQHTERT